MSQGIRLPNQEYSESREDLKVKVLGGYVRVNRSWVAGRWYMNPAWANLRFIADPMGGVLAVDRAASLYERTGTGAGNSGSALYALGSENFIAQQDSGWRWYDRLGSYLESAGIVTLRWLSTLKPSEMEIRARLEQVRASDAFFSYHADGREW